MTLDDIRSRLITLLSMTEDIERECNRQIQKGFEPSEEILNRVKAIDIASEDALAQAAVLISILHG